MRTFLRLVSLDIRKSLASQWLRYPVCFVVACALTVLAVLYAQYYYSVDASSPYVTAPFTLGDGIVNLFSGNSEYIPSDTAPYTPPVTWLTIMFLAIFTALDYPWNDLMHTGRQAIIMCGSRTTWWLSKCAWTVFSVALFLVSIGLGIAAGVLLTGGTLSLTVSEQVPLYLEFDPYALQEAPWSIGPLLVVFPRNALCAVPAATRARAYCAPLAKLRRRCRGALLVRLLYSCAFAWRIPHGCTKQRLRKHWFFPCGRHVLRPYHHRVGSCVRHALVQAHRPDIPEELMIHVRHLTKTIGRTTVLNDVTAVFANGHITGLQGINGSGKTMLIRALAGLIKPTSGTIAIDGERLWKDIALPPSIGALIENPSFLDAYTGFANLKMLASFRGRATDDDLQSILQTVGLDPGDKRKYRKYSLGMKQRLGIAAAVMEQPDVVLLDEPTNALDESGLAMLHDLVLAQKERGAVVVLASHDRDFLVSLADEVYEFSEGHIVAHRLCTSNEVEVDHA